MHYVTTTLVDHVATVQFDQPKKLNALSEPMIEEIIEALEDCRARKARVVILRARPGVKVWSAGHDVSELPRGKRDPLGWDDPLRQVIRAIEELPIPVIALIEGGVWGGACELALVCDVTLSTTESTFAVTPAKLGVPYNATGLITFKTVVPMPALKELIFTAAPISAKRAHELGIVNHVRDKDEIEAYAANMAQQIAQNAPLSIAVAKEQLRILASASSMTPRMFERIQGLRRVVYDSADYQEGLTAFDEKRKPVFTGE
ncbi:MAG: methylmalonyl-CoA decarboxylase [Rhodospirillaceae bacterium]